MPFSRQSCWRFGCYTPVTPTLLTPNLIERQCPVEYYSASLQNNYLSSCVFPIHAILQFFPDSEAMGFLLQITMSCPCALSRQVAGAGAGRRCWVPVLVLGAGFRCWCCQLAARGGDRLLVLVPGAVPGAGCARGGDRLLALVLGAGAGAVSWLCAWWRQVAGAGACRVQVLVL